MTCAGVNFVDEEDYVLQQRLIRFLQTRDRYKTNGPKHLAFDIDCAERTAKNILGGHWPSARHFRRIVKMFRRDVIEALFAEDIDAVNARLAAEERNLEEQLHSISERRSQDARLYACAPTADPEVRS